MQTVILALLRNPEPGLVYPSGGALITRELLDELLERELLDAERPRKQLQFTVRPACQSRQDRGLIEYVVNDDHPEARPISWKAAPAATEETLSPDAAGATQTASVERGSLAVRVPQRGSNGVFLAAVSVQLS